MTAQAVAAVGIQGLDAAAPRIALRSLRKGATTRSVRGGSLLHREQPSLSQLQARSPMRTPKARKGLFVASYRVFRPWATVDRWYASSVISGQIAEAKQKE